jgi:hypothetical protein
MSTIINFGDIAINLDHISTIEKRKIPTYSTDHGDGYEYRLFIYVGNDVYTYRFVNEDHMDVDYDNLMKVLDRHNNNICLYDLYGLKHAR